MDFGFVNTTPQSSRQLIFSSAKYLDSTSEDSSSDSPPSMNHNVFTNFPAQQYEMLNYDTTPSDFYSPQPHPISIEDIYASIIVNKGDTPRRRQSSSRPTPTASKAPQEDSSNAHSVQYKNLCPQYPVKILTAQLQRRRAQNRASQRAFRERKDKHVKGLEYQLEILHEKHQDLLQSYNQQADKVSMLSNRIGELTTELSSLRNSKESQSIPICCETRRSPGDFDSFDAFFAYDTTGGSAICYEPDRYLDKHHLLNIDAEGAFSNIDDYL